MGGLSLPGRIGEGAEGKSPLRPFLEHGLNLPEQRAGVKE
jgi:hypothetical protein